MSSDRVRINIIRLSLSSALAIPSFLERCATMLFLAYLMRVFVRARAPGRRKSPRRGRRDKKDPLPRSRASDIASLPSLVVWDLSNRAITNYLFLSLSLFAFFCSLPRRQNRTINRKSCAKSSSTLILVPTYRPVLLEAWTIGAANRWSRWR
jgi:hypothetical protein